MAEMEVALHAAGNASEPDNSHRHSDYADMLR
jgi:hypothetical protein